jgi:putative transposase
VTDEAIAVLVPRIGTRAASAAADAPQATHFAAVKPELVASGPNQVYSWDITKLHGPAKWISCHLHVILDISAGSRGLDGRHPRIRRPGRELIAATCAKQSITGGQRSIHADRGSSMISKPVALLLADLGVTQSHFRPHVSSDNPYSEA